MLLSLKVIAGGILLFLVIVGIELAFGATIEKLMSFSFSNIKTYISLGIALFITGVGVWLFFSLLYLKLTDQK